MNTMPLAQFCGVQSFARGNDKDGNQMIGIILNCLEDLDIETLIINKVDGRKF